MTKFVIYLDHGATSWPKPNGVLCGIAAFMAGVAGNAGRSGHYAAVESARMVYQAREQLSRILGIPDPADLVFTHGTTESLNLVLKGFLRDGDHILVSPMEHNSVMRPIKRLARERNIKYTFLPADKLGRIDMENAKITAGKGPYRLIAISHASNVNGIVQDLASLRDVFPDTPILIDAAQTAGVLPIDVMKDRIDFVAFSGHKGLLGPTGIGACYISPRYEVAPLMEGGTGSKSESIDQPDFRPDRYEAGTINLHGIAGLRGGLDHIEENGLGGEHKRRLTLMIINGIRDIPRVKLYSPDDGTALMAAFTVEGMHTDQVAQALENEFSILCRAGMHCSPTAHLHLGTMPQGAVRLAPGYGNLDKEIEITIKAVKKIAGKI